MLTGLTNHSWHHEWSMVVGNLGGMKYFTVDNVTGSRLLFLVDYATLVLPTFLCHPKVHKPPKQDVHLT